jgi:pimeloyl-ACP methyl ester carboxylesterase
MPITAFSSSPGKTIRLADGRSLGWAEYGDPHGQPVLFFHGIPGSRLFHHPDDALTASLGVRLIALDRPGYGLSDFQPNRRILDWPDDVLQLADALKLDRFAVAGHSGGGPYVVACAYKIPHRLSAAAILSGAGPVDAPGATQGMQPLNRAGFRVGRYVPWPLWRLAVWFFFRKGRDDPEAMFERGAKARPKADEIVFARPEVKAVCYRSEAEALRRGMLGHAWEARLLCRPWGFRPQDISMRVHLWHGDADVETPISMGRYMASAIPDCCAAFCRGEGHLLLFDHWQEILAALTHKSSERVNGWNG